MLQRALVDGHRRFALARNHGAKVHGARYAFCAAGQVPPPPQRRPLVHDALNFCKTTIQQQPIHGSTPPSHAKTRLLLGRDDGFCSSHHDFFQMLIARRCLLRCARTVTSPAAPGTRRSAATAVPPTGDPDDGPPRPRPRAADESIESYVRTVRDDWGHYIPAGLLSPDEYRVYERYYGPPLRTLSSDDMDAALKSEEPDDGESAVTLEDIDGIRIEQQREAEAEAEAEDEPAPDGLLRTDAHPVDGRRPPARIHPLTRLGQFGTYPATVAVPGHAITTTASFLSDCKNKHLSAAASRLFGGDRLPWSPLVTAQADKHYNAIPLDTAYGMSDLESNVHLATVLPGYYAQSLSALTELRRRLGGDWLLGRPGTSEPGVRQILDVGSGGAGILAWRSIVEAEQAVRSEPTKPAADHNPADGPADSSADGGGPGLSPGLRPVVVIGSDSLRYRMSRLLENTTFIPRLPDTTTTAATTNTTHPLPLPNDIHGPAMPAQKQQQQQPRKLYDLILSTNTILPISENHKRKAHIQNLWSLLNPNGGVLLLIEKGTPLGFEAVAGARRSLLDLNISTTQSPFAPITDANEIFAPRIPKETASIVAPCTNHQECPMYIHGPGSRSRRDYCSFVQRYERPAYMQRILGATARNHDDLRFSYLAVRRGVDVKQQQQQQPSPSTIDPRPEDFDTTTYPPSSPYSMAQLRSHAYTLPRTVFPPIKCRGHIILDVCTAQGKIERWVVPRSYSKTAYHDARKSRWGDLWALGAKTQRPRNLQLGDSERSKASRPLAHLAPDGFEVDKPGGKKKNPGKRARDRRQAQREVQKSRQVERDAVRLVAESLA